jgi:hypothetical protein
LGSAKGPEAIAKIKPAAVGMVEFADNIFAGRAVDIEIQKPGSAVLLTDRVHLSLFANGTREFS